MIFQNTRQRGKRSVQDAVGGARKKGLQTWTKEKGNGHEMIQRKGTKRNDLGGNHREQKKLKSRQSKKTGKGEEGSKTFSNWE